MLATLLNEIATRSTVDYRITYIKTHYLNQTVIRLKILFNPLVQVQPFLHGFRFKNKFDQLIYSFVPIIGLEDKITLPCHYVIMKKMNMLSKLVLS